ncbi:MAG TPA: lysyl oxidase family protein [Solirubrobacterales bacterium]|nr:lysyl oxidase family protein [Solirubrobacterales bacterium]
MDSLAAVKRRFSAVLAATSLLLGMFAGQAAAAPGGAAAPSPSPNPCIGPEGRQLLCPDLRVGPAEDLFVARRGSAYGSGGGTLLYAGNNIMSRGRGPMELRGHRYKRNWMRANQAIYEAGGGVRVFRTEARLHFFDVGYEWGGSYWKVENPLSMEVWSLDGRGRPLERVRKGPKVFYCFRDLERTKAMRRSPGSRVYPGCSQDPGRKRVRLGTSVGWSDIYPSDYDRQWVNVSGLRGCFAFVMRVDPLNLLFEEHEGNNRSVRIVRLPYRDGPQRC